MEQKRPRWIPQRSKTGLAAIVFLAAIIAALSSVAYERLAAESSPIARGASYAATHRCFDNLCTRELRADRHLCADLGVGTSCNDVIAFWTAKRLERALVERTVAAPENLLLQGEALARKRNCFQCHGELGQGGVANSGALKGYIPGYFGNDFRNLTEEGDREAIKEWIRTGSSTSVTEHPLTGFMASYFFERQSVSMPAFASLPEHEIDLLASYLIVLNQLGPLSTEGLKCYALLTSQRNRSNRELPTCTLSVAIPF